MRFSIFLTERQNFPVAKLLVFAFLILLGGLPAAEAGTWVAPYEVSFSGTDQFGFYFNSDLGSDVWVSGETKAFYQRELDINRQWLAANQDPRLTNSYLSSIRFYEYAVSAFSAEVGAYTLGIFPRGVPTNYVKQISLYATAFYSPGSSASSVTEYYPDPSRIIYGYESDLPDPRTGQPVQGYAYADYFGGIQERVVIRAPDGYHIVVGQYYLVSASHRDRSPFSLISKMTIDEVYEKGEQPLDFDLSIAQIKILDSKGQDAPLKFGRPVLSSGEAATAMVKITGKNIRPTDGRSSSISLTFDNQTVSTGFTFSSIASGSAWISIPFSATNSTSDSEQALSFYVNQHDSPEEEDRTNNQMASSVRVLFVCNVAQKGTVVPYFGQYVTPWATDTYGNPRPPRAPRSVKAKGCALSSLAMLANSYGIKKNADGLPLDPGRLNVELQRYKSSDSAPYGISFDIENDIIWPGAVDNLRNDVISNCVSEGGLVFPCLNKALGKISYFGMGKFNQEKIEAEVCSGNPVMLHVRHTGKPKPSHFVLAVGTAKDEDGNKTFLINDPGALDGENNLLSDKYEADPTYRLFRSNFDPSMFFIHGTENIEYILTDSQGRRTGKNPFTGETFAEIPGTEYYDELIGSDDPMDTEPDRAVHVLQSLQPVDGSYTIDIFSSSGGDYSLETFSFDTTGTFNVRAEAKGKISKNGQARSVYNHSSLALPTLNASIKVRDGHISSGEQAHLYVAGKLKAIDKTNNKKLALNSVFEFKVGDSHQITKSVPFSKFVKIPILGCSIYSNSKDKLWAGVCQDGKFWVFSGGLNLANMSDAEKSKFQLKIDSLSGAVTIDSNRHRSCKDHHEGF